MKFQGIQKLTLLDYPNKVACTLFTYGCDFRCPFCHNALLVTKDRPREIPREEIFGYLDKRKGVLDGVCVTGGEPLMQDGVAEFLSEVKKRGLSVKLDTNGSFPDRLISLAGDGLVDYVAMDVKNSKERYAETAGAAVDIAAIEKSVAFLMNGKVDYEFRTTAVKGLHDENSMKSLAKWIAGAKRYYIQNFVDSGELIGKAEGLSLTEMRKLLETARKYVPSAELRGL